MGSLNKKRLLIIPARGGSKRIPRKNIRQFLGRPLILRVLEEVTKEKLFDDVHVSSEDDEILQLVSQFGFSPEFSRDPSLSDDFTPLSLVTTSVLNQYLELGKSFDTIVLVYATAAFLRFDTLKSAIEKFESLGPGVKMISVAEYPVPIEWAMRMSDKNELTPTNPSGLEFRSQDLEPAWYETAEFVIYDETSIQPTNPDIKQIGYPITHMSIDIDTEEDWIKAEKIAKTDHN